MEFSLLAKDNNVTISGTVYFFFFALIYAYESLKIRDQRKALSWSKEELKFVAIICFL